MKVTNPDNFTNIETTYFQLIFPWESNEDIRFWIQGPQKGYVRPKLEILIENPNFFKIIILR